MLRVLLILVFLCTPLLAQSVSFGVHGCGAWSKLEMSNEESSTESDYETFYGAGVDVSFKPPLSPIGVEAGATYLFRKEKDETLDIEGTFKTHPLYVNGKFYLSPMSYVFGGVNYTIWGIEVEDEEVENMKGKLGFQAGVGLEIGAGGTRIYVSGCYMIQKGTIEDESVGDIDIETKSLQLRVGLKFGG